MSEPVFTVANQLTLLRMALAPLLVVLVLSREHGWALATFVLAGLSDALDGLIARRGGQQTTLGAMLDPIADKVLMGGAYVVLTWANSVICAIPVWLTVTLLSRDAIIVVTVAVVNLTVGRRVFPPSLLGKAATAAQILTAGLVLLANAMGGCPRSLVWVFWTTLVLIVTSAVHYVYVASVHPPAPSWGGSERR
jgi:cardiolipin synthase (CMP-forming)